MASSVPRTAIVTFAAGSEASRRIAGVAAAARIVRELAQAGVDTAWLIAPDGLGPAAQRDIERLADGMEVEIAVEPPPALEQAADLIRLAGDRLVRAEALGGAGDAESIRLDSAGAAAAILARTGKSSDGPVSRWLNRPLSRRLSALLLLVPGVRPIHATVGTALLAAAMFAALVAGGGIGLIAGALLFQAASIFDGVDGEIARATFRTSPSGAVIDSAVDVATNFGFVIGLTVNLALQGSETALALSAWGFVLFALGLSVIAWRAVRAHGPFSLDLVKHQYRRRFPSAAVGRLIRFLTIMASRDFFALLFALLILAGLPMAVLCLFAAAATVWILFVLGSIRLPVHSAATGTEAAPSLCR